MAKIIRRKPSMQLIVTINSPIDANYNYCMHVFYRHSRNLLLRHFYSYTQEEKKIHKTMTTKSKQEIN
jgi:hypothetical protein